MEENKEEQASKQVRQQDSAPGRDLSVTITYIKL